jgi:hypothetical protein
MTVLMRNREKKVLPFPEPPEEPANSPIVVQIGNERFAIHYEIEDLPPAAPLSQWKLPAKKSEGVDLEVVSSGQRHRALFRERRRMNVWTEERAGNHYAVRNDILSPSHAGGARLPVRHLVGLLAGWMAKYRLQYVMMLVKVPKQNA